ncbi:contractile injection system tape measure protein [Flavobacterium cellulosilyticum]|uniref:Uncharacterized protein n=1 Tax=Flavobacterium cellulosilyticum TaxID=2541731 RepID=A0A4R5CFJ4_9FLAO|nr:contractile injection system tape measure protein [Flavobacterium cellulosilyticum]TDD96002.1 hypothetical protein E0F76_12905 [Flavobacterium cellulosilyticum]
MHLIQQHTFDIQCSTQEFGKEIHSQLSLLLEKEFYPKLETLFNKYDSKNKTLRVEVLNIEVASISKKYWKEELVQKSLTQIEAFLNRNQLSYLDEKGLVNIDFISNSTHAEYVFIEFLKTGKIIENAIVKDLEKLVYEVEVSTTFIQEVLLNFEKNSSSLLRWIFSVPDFFKEIFIKKLDGFSTGIEGIKISTDKINSDSVLKKQWIEYVHWICYFENKEVSKDIFLNEFVQFSEDFFEIKSKELSLVCQHFIENNNSISVINDLFEKIKKNIDNDFSGREVENFEDGFQVNIAKKEIGLGNKHYIKNAGVIILHPFFKALFEQLNLCEADGLWKSKRSQQKAILLTQYLVNSDEKIQESDLILNKVLCGLSMEEVVNVKLKITGIEIDQCNSLLEAVKEHWKVMSTSSTEALQQTFLQREAKFELVSENEYELWVEEKGVDILLEQLPWGISMIQTPWMDSYLSCHWS